jgi:hypothetical protein
MTDEEWELKRELEMKEIRRRTCANCGSPDAELILSTIMCDKCGHRHNCFSDIRYC